MKTISHFRYLFLISMGMLATVSAAGSMSPAPSIVEKNVTYTSGGVTFKGYVAYDSNLKGKRPAIIVVPEWWGLNDYVKMRARMLAELGYIAMAADMFGNGKIAANPKEAQELTAPFYKDPMLSKTRLDAAVKEIKKFEQTDPSNIAAIGYCFGGGVVLNSAKLGEDLKGVVSFHGSIAGGAPVNKQLLKAKILVCQGDSDKFAPLKDVYALRHQLDSIGADNTFKIFHNAEHAFTNPDATKLGKEFNLPIRYDAKADAESWNDMKVFLNRIFKK
jgi:dienelactone hydrolase